MDLRDRHQDVAAYALGVLDPADVFRFEEHLAECVECAVRLLDFAPVTSALADLGGAGMPVASPSSRLLEGLLGAVVQEHRRSARRRLRLVAVAAALIVGLPALTAGLRGGGTDGGVERIAATDRATGVYGAADLRASDSGTAVALRIARLRGPRACQLLVVGADGEKHQIGTWSVRPAGYGIPGSPEAAEPLDIEVGTALYPEEIERFEVRTMEGEHLVTLAH
ncbi:zf-HC2 domain-containing protein [Streptomyces sp. NPDC059176]|uniref:zf-HC2 domain-containing protein n=1 Tax=unclassified Streptomyces TaxID=2593676 RepID=UPI0036A7B799